MGEPVWPTKRADGSVSVAARFDVSDPDGFDSVRRCVARWLAEKAEAGVEIGRDLSMPPQTAILDMSKIEVVFDGRAGSRMWKDWLVDLTREITASVDGVRFEGFQDRVSGVFRLRLPRLQT